MFKTDLDINSKYNIIIRDKNIIIQSNNTLPTFKIFSKIKNELNNPIFFYENQLNLSVLEISTDEELDANLKEIPIREFFSFGNEYESIIVSRAKSLLNWRKNMIFCPKCATQLIDSKTLSAKECNSCKTTFFPRIEPCIIVLIKKDDKILLVKHTYRNQDIYACIAGFIEAGESAEHAVVREAKEEVGIKIKNVQYKGSQSWPFPDQLMLAYTAEYDSGKIVLQEDEIADAKWFSIDENIASPKPGSVAYKLIHNQF